MRDDVLSAVLKRARGYEATETVEEYAAVEGELTLVKKRITKKDVPPDIAAVKMLADIEPSIGEMSDEQLMAEKARLVAELVKADAKGGAMNKPP